LVELTPLHSKARAT